MHSKEEIHANQAKKKAAKIAYYEANRDEINRTARERRAAKSRAINEEKCSCSKP